VFQSQGVQKDDVEIAGGAGLLIVRLGKKKKGATDPSKQKGDQKRTKTRTGTGRSKFPEKTT